MGGTGSCQGPCPSKVVAGCYPLQGSSPSYPHTRQLNGIDKDGPEGGGGRPDTTPTAAAGAPGRGPLLCGGGFGVPPNLFCMRNTCFFNIFSIKFYAPNLSDFRFTQNRQDERSLSNIYDVSFGYFFWDRATKQRLQTAPVRGLANILADLLVAHPDPFISSTDSSRPKFTPGFRARVVAGLASRWRCEAQLSCDCQTYVLTDIPV